LEMKKIGELSTAANQRYIELKMDIKLNGSNFTPWSTMVLKTLGAAGLEQVVEGNGKEREKKEVIRFIMASMTEEVMITFRHMDDPLVLWKRLNELYARPNDQLITNLTGELYEMKCKSEWELPEYVAKMKRIMTEIEARGGNMKENDKCRILVRRLPPSFSNYVAAYNGEDFLGLCEDVLARGK